MQNEAKLLTITQAAKLLQVSPDTLRRWEERGIIVPHRTKGGSRRYTLLDLKIAKLNKRKARFLNLSYLGNLSHLASKRDLKIALLTSFLWVVGLLIYPAITSIFLGPANPQQQIVSDQLKQETRLKVASGMPSQISKIKVVVTPNQTPVTEKTVSKVSRLESDLLLIQRPDNQSTLQFADTPLQYYSLQPLPKNQIPTVIKRS